MGFTLSRLGQKTYMPTLTAFFLSLLPPFPHPYAGIGTMSMIFAKNGGTFLDMLVSSQNKPRSQLHWIETRKVRT